MPIILKFDTATTYMYILFSLIKIFIPLPFLVKYFLLSLAKEKT